jgi:hypothetical protein
MSPDTPRYRIVEKMRRSTYRARRLKRSREDEKVNTYKRSREDAKVDT